MTHTRLFAGLALALLIAAPVACGDDDTTTGPGTGGMGGDGGDGTGGDGTGGDGTGASGAGGNAGGPEICNNQTDDDLDGLTDCADDDCATDIASCWTCDPAFYDEDEAAVEQVFCDCGCGVPDPDCTQDPSYPVFGCDMGSTCDMNGMCVEPPPEMNCDNGIDDNDNGLTDCDDPGCLGETGCPPVTWTCEPAFYDEDPNEVENVFCDCACGEPDPDCAQDPNAPVFGCMDGEICDANGLCQAGSAENCSNGIDDDGDFAADCADDDCLGETGCAPVGWTCNPLDYDQAAPNEICDCECGVLDPDCSNPANPSSDCVQGESCNTTTLTCDQITGEVCDNTTDDDNDGLADCMDQECYTFAGCSPPGWICNPSLYDEPAATEGCDCNCGTYDPDCDNAAAPIYGCGMGFECNMQGQCAAPAAWTCPAGFYANNDGCDCGCGAQDPDCLLEVGVAAGCTLGSEAACCGFCSEMGSCNTQMMCPGDIDPNDNTTCI